MSGRFTKGRVKVSDTLGPGEMWVPEKYRKSKPISDGRLLSREFYNANEFPVAFERQKAMDDYVRAAGKPLGPDAAICQPGEWLLMPHYFFEASWPERDKRPPEEVIAHWNHGNEIGIGMKPNREETRRARRYVR